MIKTKSEFLVAGTPTPSVRTEPGGVYAHRIKITNVSTLDREIDVDGIAKAGLARFASTGTSTWSKPKTFVHGRIAPAAYQTEQVVEPVTLVGTGTEHFCCVSYSYRAPGAPGPGTRGMPVDCSAVAIS
jgi:hypothetical protein